VSSSPADWAQAGEIVHLCTLYTEPCTTFAAGLADLLQQAASPQSPQLPRNVKEALHAATRLYVLRSKAKVHHGPRF
jgi:hypothetical protein